jgi:peptidoglycan/LPS O-acetylase OafA/YrhL
MDKMNPNQSKRRCDLDWLRVLVILTVFVFHCGRFFDTEGWHVKNPVRHESVMIWTGFLVTWMMPLIFFISGASTWYALKSRSVGTFVKERALRLLVPLVLGIFTHVAFQVYLERQGNSGFKGSFFEFYPHYFQGWYAFGGNFAWMGLHLWYLEMLFLYSVLLLPLFVFLAREAGIRRLDQFRRGFAKSGVVYFLAIPQIVLMAALNPHSFWGQRGFGGWPLPVYIFIFLYGFLLVSREELELQIEKLRSVSLGAAAVLLLVALGLWKSGADQKFGTSRYVLLFSSLALCSWCFVLGLFGLARRHLAFSNSFVRYANEGVLPFYILHQSVILAVGVRVIRWDIPDTAKFAVIGVVSFACIAGFYELFIRRNNLMRFLFGMKSRPAQAIESWPLTGQTQAKEGGG